MQEYSVEVALVHPDDMVNLFGSNERHLKLIEENLGVVIHARTERVQILGETEEAIELARLTIKALLVLVGRGMIVNTSDVVTALSMAQNGNIDKFVALYEEEIIKDSYGKPIRVKTLGQKVYVDSVKSHDIVFGIGPAGTGKTFLAVTLAITALKRGQVKRIILTRPAVEAGESLGFLQEILRKKLIPICVLFMMLSIRFWGKSKPVVSWSVRLLKLHLWLICAVELWTMLLSFWMKRRILPSCR